MQKDVDNYISIGQYSQALTFLKSIENERQLTNKELLSKQYVEIFILLDKGEFQKGCDLADEMINNSRLQKNKLREIDAIIAKTENSNCLGLFNDSFKFINEAEHILENLKKIPNDIRKQKQAYLFYLKGRINRDSHNVIDAIKLFKKSYELRKEINDKFGMMWSLLNWASIITAIGNFKSADKYFNESLTIAKNLDVEVGIIWNYIYLGWLKYHIRDLGTAINLAEKCLAICEPKNYKYSSTRCYDLIGHCYLIKGDVNKALSFFKKSLEIRIEIGYNSYVAQSYFSIGKVYRQKGELKRSLNYFKKVLDISPLDDRQMSKPTYLSALGKIYCELGDFKKAKKFLLEALELLKNKQMFLFQFLNYNVSIATTLHYLIVLSINMNDSDKIYEYLNMLEFLSQKYPNLTQINQIYKLDKAIILNSSKRLMDKMEAGSILMKLIDEEIIDYEILIETMSTLSDILMYELEITGDIKILNEIEELTNKMNKIAENQELFSLFAEINFFKAKISLLNLDIDNARLLLTKAQNIANEHGLVRLANKISNEHDFLLGNLNDWENKIKEKVPLLQRLKESKNEFLFSKLVQLKYGDLSNESENPVYILILSPYDGRCLYNKAFQEMSFSDGNLFSSFISAINIFGKTAFSTTDSIDRIRHGEYLIVLQPKNKFLFAYIFKGQSYSAISKLDEFIKIITLKKPLVKDLIESLKNHTEILEQTYLNINEIVNDIFIMGK
ncbi:MAG: tetratricopeptide repeat protein [Candidatus Lokiarchaeota archaeon]|nr:tetratricopeptide repeat protein [Candidatus Lokiarchaeota archaeon]